MKKLLFLVVIILVIAMVTVLASYFNNVNSEILVSPNQDGGGRAILDSIFFVI